ncbi:MAG TPA: bifunctional 3'-5' exonuclease/DNA polymerase, partial [Lacisediminihabitans sp.]
MYVALFQSPDGPTLQPLDAAGHPTGSATTVDDTRLAEAVAALEREHPRWVWDDTSRWHPRLLAEGVRVERCVDLRLSHNILRHSSLTARSRLATGPVTSWDRPAAETIEREPSFALFDLDEPDAVGGGEDVVAEFSLQREAVATAEDPPRLGLLLAAESAGALVAAEMFFAGLPWREDIHDAILTEHLGPRPSPGQRPAKLEAALGRLRQALEAPTLNPDSPADLLRALGVAGLMVTSTRSWELKKLRHPAIPPLLEYKKL